ncbi:GMC oxidoreductase [Actinomadura sp. ATCC 31491]|uniref:GMC oxidoreductase n=1 Tax=Actinomadura luzonensis TaxID=2805427 RepID=A0ABT0G1N7_9ACTN|nr:GMC oxidoreductase [Actinomadura luzonensis]MCK2218498.1 GMC oxidoreductase [Actinomadura luzonensis]
MFDPHHPDVLIIGAGPVGATYARVLLTLHENITVTIVDAGSQLSENQGMHLRNQRVYQDNWNTFGDVVTGNLQKFSRVLPGGGYQETLDRTAFTQPGARFDFYNPEQDPTKNLSAAAGAYAVGGMSTLWTCAVPRPHPTMERSSLIKDSEWDKLFDVGEKFLRKSTTEFDFERNRVVKEAMTEFFASRPHDYKYPVPGNYPVQNLPMAARRQGTGDFGDKDGFVKWTGVDDILAPVRQNSQMHGRLAILPDHLVRRLRSDDKPNPTSRIDYAEVQDFRNRKTISIKANHFVVATGPIFGPQLLWNSNIRHPALGRYLNDQTVASCMVVLGKDLVARFKDDKGHTGIAALPPNAAEPQVWVPVSEKRPWHVQIHQDPINFSTPGPELVDQRLLVFLQWFGMTEPMWDNRVRFSEKYTDVMGMPQPIFEYELPPKAVKEAHEMIGELAEAALALGGWLPGHLPEFEPPGASLHLQSTTRMGDKSDDSVVDVNSKHWGFDNLRVGGINVIPTATACNPTPTAVAIAVRAAAHLALGRVPTDDDYDRILKAAEQKTAAS